MPPGNFATIAIPAPRVKRRFTPSASGLPRQAAVYCGVDGTGAHGRRPARQGGIGHGPLLSRRAGGVFEPRRSRAWLRLRWPARSGTVRAGCDSDLLMSIVLLIAGIALGAACALAFARRRDAGDGAERLHERQRLRDELRSLSADVLVKTGDSLAQRLEDQRRAEQERAAGEMGRRTEEIRGLVAPVQEKLGRMESEIGRLERERRQAQGELAKMLDQ